jgi:nicotinate-nucleotide pyrophosphorylase (carboxylating)
VPRELDIPQASLDEVFRSACASGLVRRVFELAADEDLGMLSRRAPDALPAARRESRYAGDLTTEACIAPDVRATASLVARAPGVVSGLACVPMLLEVFCTDVAWRADAKDGEAASKDAVLGSLEGPLDELLVVERTLLNMLGRLSGVATHARAYVQRTQGTSARIYDTRKTTPGLRALEKYAVRCGGAQSHRMGLFDAVLIKDNHLAGVGVRELPAFVNSAMERTRELAGQRDVYFQVEVDSLEQFEALLTGVPRGLSAVLLDNMTTDMLRMAVSMRAAHKRGEVALEASGGVTLDTVTDIAKTGVDRISVGAMTHSSVQLDVAMDISRTTRRSTREKSDKRA